MTRGLSGFIDISLCFDGTPSQIICFILVMISVGYMSSELIIISL